MIQRAELLHEVSNKLIIGSGMAEFMNFATECPEYALLSIELDSAHNWLSGIVKERDPQVFENIPNLIALLETCAQMARDAGYPFLAADFDGLADDAGCLEIGYSPLEIRSPMGHGAVN
jgi:hypothetical protein